MFAFGNEAFWLNVTNAALGVVLSAFVVAVVLSVVHEIVFSRKDRRV